MAAHEQADGKVEEHGERHAEHKARRGASGTDEHHLVHFYSADDELVQGNAHHQTHQRADEREQVDLPEDVAVDLLVIEAKNFDGGKLLFALAQVRR